MFNGRYNEYKNKGNENISTEQYLEKNRPYLGNMIDEFKKSGERKIHLTMKVNFVSSKDNNDKQLIHSKCDNMQKSWLATKTDEINHKLFKLLINRDELGLQESRKVGILLLIVLIKYVINVIK